MAQLTYKKLTAEDVPAYLDLLKKMAKFEELEDIFVCTEEMLQKYIVEEEKQEVYLILEDGTNVGFTCFYCASPVSIWTICLSCRSTGAKATAS